MSNPIGSASPRPTSDDRVTRNTGSLSRRPGGAGGDAPAARRIGRSYAGPNPRSLGTRARAARSTPGVAHGSRRPAAPARRARRADAARDAVRPPHDQPEHRAQPQPIRSLREHGQPREQQRDVRAQPRELTHPRASFEAHPQPWRTGPGVRRISIALGASRGVVLQPDRARMRCGEWGDPSTKRDLRRRIALSDAAEQLAQRVLSRLPRRVLARLGARRTRRIE